jgi:hypothetical protein
MEDFGNGWMDDHHFQCNNSKFLRQFLHKHTISAVLANASYCYRAEFAKLRKDYIQMYQYQLVYEVMRITMDLCDLYYLVCGALQPHHCCQH